jgi:hypothetical protein
VWTETARGKERIFKGKSASELREFNNNNNNNNNIIIIIIKGKAVPLQA